MARITVPILLMLALAGCASPKVWLLADGRIPSQDPVLNQQLAMDKTICTGKMQAANVSGVTFTGGGLAGVAAAAQRDQAVGAVGVGCMAEKGYVLVPEDQVAQKSAELSEIAAVKASAEKVNADKASAQKASRQKQSKQNDERKL
jgi:hypothetical protein